MKAVLVSLPPAEIEALGRGRSFIWVSRPIRTQQDKPLDILIYSSRTAGGSGLVVAKGLVGAYREHRRGGLDADISSYLYAYGVKVDEHDFGLEQIRRAQEVIHFQYLPRPLPIEACISTGAANPPSSDWKYIYI